VSSLFKKANVDIYNLLCGHTQIIAFLRRGVVVTKELKLRIYVSFVKSLLF
jgi:hypothetical protein